MESLVRVLDRQGLLKGDLNGVQFSMLNWLMGNEVEEDAERERNRFEMQALAANEQTNPQLLRHLQSLREEAEEEEVEWVTPQSEEELSAMLQDFESLPWEAN
jgi:hypothetical protein